MNELMQGLDRVSICMAIAVKHDIDGMFDLHLVIHLRSQAEIPRPVESREWLDYHLLS